LIGAYDLAIVFRVELPGEGSRVHEITKQHRKLPALGLRGATLGWGSNVVERGIWRDSWLRHCLRQWQRRCCWCVSYTGPHQEPAALIDRQLLYFNNFGLQILKIRRIKVKLPLQRPIADPLMSLEESQDPLEHVIKVHHHPSCCP
jgi:hypothetical protein